MFTAVDVVLIGVLAVVVLGLVYVIERAHAEKQSWLSELKALIAKGVLTEKHVVAYVEAEIRLTEAKATAVVHHAEAAVIGAKADAAVNGATLAPALVADAMAPVMAAMAAEPAPVVGSVLG